MPRALGLSTAFHPGLTSAGPDALLDALVRGGARGVVLDGRLSPPLYELLASRLAARRDELPIWAIESPCPLTRAATAQLASLDRSESHAAIEAAEETMVRAAELGAARLLLSLGEVASLARDWPAIRRAFLRGSLATDGRGRERLLRERAQKGSPHLDAARRALDRLARRAEAAGLRLAIRNPPRVVGLPSLRELPLLLGELDGAPVEPALDLAAAHLDEAMGLGSTAATVEQLRHATLVLFADACAGVVGLPPGRGEIDLPPLCALLDEHAQVCFHPSAGLSIAEVEMGARATAALTGC